jgi:hypothetical protein
MSKKKHAPELTAATADPHVLYELSVQCPEADVDFLDKVYQKAYGRKPHLLREDFCGTAALCAEWVRRGGKRRAVGVDLHGPTLAWGEAHNLAPLGDARARVILRQTDVRDPEGPAAEVRVAFNFSYFVFKQRGELLEYFRAAREGLADEGLFAIDLLGGPDAQSLLEESRELEGFDYVWDQAAFNPIDHSYRCHIHFDFPDGTRMEKAFTYDWRLWNLMELRDVLADAGFSRTEVYWEGTEPGTDEGNGVFKRRRKVDNEACWVAYVVAWP